jgi:tetratricopeptide (TPR) repeat protein
VFKKVCLVRLAAAQALAVDPPRGKHMVHSNLSAAYLQAGKKEAALQHAQEAVALAPAGFHMVS